MLTTLAHHIDVDLLREAYRRTRKDGAVGIDGLTAQAYAKDLEGNLQSLLDRFKSGRYRAPAVRAVRIPKRGRGSQTRSLGIPTFEDKVLQRAVLMVLEAVYEQDFLDCSYGFRPGRSAHQALEGLWRRTMKMSGGWVVDVDLQDFFESLDHRHLRRFLDQRVRDGVLRRTIDKWLKAGVLEDGQIRGREAGTPQGGVVSPLLANLYLHHVLDVWFTRQVVPRLRGQAFLVRYADDFLLVFTRKDDAERVWKALPTRLGGFGLRVHPEKTRMVRFRKPTAKSLNGSRGSRPGAFDFLGFTHHWGKSRKGRLVIKRRTSGKSLSRARREMNQWLRHHRHVKIADQHRMLCRKLRGHFGYYGITGNSRSLVKFRWSVLLLWRKWLGRRSQRGDMFWDRYRRILARYPLPPPVAVHSAYRRAANP